MTESHSRTVARAVSYRLMATGLTAVFTGLGQAIVIHVILTVVHYVMERLWLKIQWGKIDHA